MEGVILCPVCGDRQGLPDGSACPRCNSVRDPLPAATPQEIAGEHLNSRLYHTRATLTALAGLLDQYGLADSFAEALSEIGDAVHRRHDALAADL